MDLDHLLVINLPPNAPLCEDVCLHSFVMKTCQRTLIIQSTALPASYRAPLDLASAECFRGPSAYQFLLATICGLYSPMLGENEIVAQFKTAFQEYLKKGEKSALVMRVLQKLFKDGKEIRTKYMHGLGQQSYAGVTRKILQEKKTQSPVLILGSGAMCLDLIKLLKKKYQLFISARNDVRLNLLGQEHGIGLLPWGPPQSFLQWPCILNTIGAEVPLFHQDFFQAWRHNHGDAGTFVDLSSPTCIESSFASLEQVYRLEEIFKRADVLGQEKKERIALIEQEVVRLSERRAMYLQLPSSIDPAQELQFA